MKDYIGNPKEKLMNLMDPANPVMSGVVQNQDSYMKGKMAQRWYYDRVGPALEEAFDEFARKTGRRYGHVEPYRCEDAEYIRVGIDHPLALKRAEDPDLRPKGGFSMRGHSVGGFGSVTTNKVIATIAGNVFGKDVQAYPKYGSEKKGLPTTYYLTIADSHIDMHSELEHVDRLCINDPTAIMNPLTLDGLQAGGSIFMQSPHVEPAVAWKHVPASVQKIIRDKKYKIFFCDMV